MYIAIAGNIGSGKTTLTQMLTERYEAKAYLGLSEEEGLVWGMIRGCMSSVSRLCIIQMQDYLELGGEARMNFPGVLSGNNWVWRAKPGFFTPELVSKIQTVTKRFGRIAR